MTQTAFERAAAVESLGDGRFGATVDTSWSGPFAPSGGYIAAIMVRALLAHLDPAGARRLRSLTLHYLRPSVAGELVIEVETVRDGRRIATGRIRALQGGKEIMAGLGAIGAPDLPATGSWAPLPPPAFGPPPPPREAGVAGLGSYRPGAGVWLDQEGSPAPIAKRVRIAPTRGGQPFSGQELAPGEAAEAATWLLLAEPQPIDAAVVALATDFWWPPAFDPLTAPALAATIDATIHVRADVPPDGLPDQPIFACFRTAANQDGVIDEDGQLFLADGTLLAHSRQLALLSPIQA